MSKLNEKYDIIRDLEFQAILDSDPKKKKIWEDYCKKRDEWLEKIRIKYS